MSFTGYAQCLVASLLLVFFTPTASGDALLAKHGMLASIARKAADTGNGLTQENVLITRIANISALEVESGGSINEGVNLYSVSSSDRISALSTLNNFRRSVQATYMNYVCWEDNVANYADYMASQCTLDVTLPANYDVTNYPNYNLLIYQHPNYTQESVASALQFLYNHGTGSSFFDVVMKDDLSYMACGQTKCSSYEMNSEYTSNVYTTVCLLYYTSPVDSFEPPFTAGTACSACPSSRHCDNGLCRDDSAFKPALQCDSSPATTPAAQNSSPAKMRAISTAKLIVVMVLTKWFQSL